MLFQNTKSRRERQFSSKGGTLRHLRECGAAMRHMHANCGSFSCYRWPNLVLFKARRREGSYSLTNTSSGAHECA